jgi:hypothetical protein
MVTKGYRKGVYERVTLGIRRETGRYGLSDAEAQCGGSRKGVVFRPMACEKPVRPATLAFGATKLA